MANQSKEQNRKTLAPLPWTSRRLSPTADLRAPNDDEKERKKETVTVATLIDRLYICFCAAGATTETKRSLLEPWL